MVHVSTEISRFLQLFFHLEFICLFIFSFKSLTILIVADLLFIYTKSNMQISWEYISIDFFFCLWVFFCFLSWIFFFKQSLNYRGLSNSVLINYPLESFESKLLTFCLINFQILQCVFSINNNILLYNHNTNIKVRRLAQIQQYLEQIIASNMEMSFKFCQLFQCIFQ